MGNTTASRVLPRVHVCVCLCVLGGGSFPFQNAVDYMGFVPTCYSFRICSLGIEDRPAKRMKMVRFGGGDDTPSKRNSRAAGGGGASASSGACQHPVWVFGLCGVCGVSKESLESSTGDQYGQYLSASASAGHGGDDSARAQVCAPRAQLLVDP